MRRQAPDWGHLQEVSGSCVEQWFSTLLMLCWLPTIEVLHCYFITVWIIIENYCGRNKPRPNPEVKAGWPNWLTTLQDLVYFEVGLAGMWLNSFFLSRNLEHTLAAVGALRGQRLVSVGALTATFHPQGISSSSYSTFLFLSSPDHESVPAHN